MKPLYKLCLLAFALSAQSAAAQSITLDTDASKADHLFASKDTVEVSYAAGFNTVAMAANFSPYTVSKATDGADWVSYRQESNGNLTFFASYYYDSETPRYATFSLCKGDGTQMRQIVVKQLPNTSASEMGDTKLAIKSGQANSTESGCGIEKSFDDDTSTLYHSAYSGGSFPFTLTYTLAKASHVDYLIYTPRTDSENGRFGKITVEVATAAAPNTWVQVATADCGKSSSPTQVDFGTDGYDNVLKIRIKISSAGTNSGKNFVSCAEMAFYLKDQTLASEMETYFSNKLCTALKPGVDPTKMRNPYLRLLGITLQNGGYSTEFRVGEFGCYLTRSTLRNKLKTSQGYDPYENPTGIYFEAGDKIVVFADGIDKSHSVSLCIKNFSNADAIGTEGQPESYYGLVNGANIIEAANRGNGYVCYYSDDYENAPTVKLHFALATESGYYDASRHTNADWKRLLQNAKSDIFDVLTQRLHVAVPLDKLKSNCPSDGERLALIYDSVIYREREIMGLPQAGIEPKNHQFARPVASGMYADGIGAAASFGSFGEWCNPSNFGFWGIGHELGHINQITPGFKWSGLGETTNNIYSSWVEHKVGAANAFGTGYHRLEDESSGIDSYSGMRGGRFEAYLEEGVRKGVSWQLQDGPDYHGTTPASKSVEGQDENGNSTETVTTTSRNYDHFLKVVPFWQLSLWTEECGKAPGAWGKTIGTYRDNFNSSTYNTGGKQQIEFMRRMCQQSGYNLCTFFEKAGMLRPIKAYIEDYSPNWLIITQSMCDKLKSDIAALGLPEAPAALNYINAYNWQTFRDEVKLTEGTVGTGCASPSGGRVRVTNSAWPGAVAYETYNASGELLHITMFGLGDSQSSSTYTYVLFPNSEHPSYIMAVGYDGTRVKIYQR